MSPNNGYTRLTQFWGRLLLQLHVLQPTKDIPIRWPYITPITPIDDTEGRRPLSCQWNSKIRSWCWHVFVLALKATVTLKRLLIGFRFNNLLATLTPSQYMPTNIINILHYSKIIWNNEYVHFCRISRNIFKSTSPVCTTLQKVDRHLVHKLKSDSICSNGSDVSQLYMCAGSWPKLPQGDLNPFESGLRVSMGKVRWEVIGEGLGGMLIGVRGV